jgi:hypothetical protein
MDQTLKVDLIMMIGTMPRRTLKIGNQKPTQQDKKLKSKPLSSNRDENKNNTVQPRAGKRTHKQP